MFSTPAICGTYLCSLIHYDSVDLEESNIEGDSYMTKLDSYVSPSVQSHHIMGINQDNSHEETNGKLEHSEPKTDFRSKEDSSVSEESVEESDDVESEKENKDTLTKFKTRRINLKVDDSTSSRTSSSSSSSSSSSFSSPSSSSSCESSSTSDDSYTESDSESESKSDLNGKKIRTPPGRKPAIYSRREGQTKITWKSTTKQDFIPLRTSPNKREFVQVEDDLDSSTTDSDSDSESVDDLTAMVEEAGFDGSGHSSESSESDNCIDLVSEDEGDEKVAVLNFVFAT